MTESTRRSFREIHFSEPKELWQLLPYEIPYGVYIDPGNLCNFSCHFCPTGNPELLKSVHRPKGMMQIELYKKIISDYTEMVRITGQKIARLHLYKDGEPLLNKNLPEMIKLAKDANIANSIETTTNGALLNSENIDDIILSGLNIIRISVEHLDDSVYAALSYGKTTYSQIREKVSHLANRNIELGKPLHIHVKIVDTGLSPEQKEQFAHDFTPISDSWNIDGIMGWSSCDLHDFTMGISAKTGMDGISGKKNRKVCPEPFTKMAINFDGSVSVCCVDWCHGTVIGNAVTENIADIWNGEKLRNFRMNHLLGTRNTIAPCANCDYITGFPDVVNLDGHCDELADVYNKI